MIFKKWLARLLAAALTLGCLPEARAAGRIVPSGNSGALNGGALGGSAADAARSIGGVPSVQVPLADLGAAELGGLPASVPLADAAIAASNAVAPVAAGEPAIMPPSAVSAPGDGAGSALSPRTPAVVAEGSRGAGSASGRAAAVPSVGPARAVAGVSAALGQPSAEGSVRQSEHRVQASLHDPFAHPEPGSTAAAEQENDPFFKAMGHGVGWEALPPEPADAPSSLAEVSLEPAPGARYTPSPEDWRDESFYSVLVDRFARAEPFASWGDPADGRTRHGGNIRGVIERLDYLKNGGVTTLLLNPLVMNPPTGYHGYWALHLMAVDPQVGTMADFKELVAEAHKRGMRVVLDTAFNHMGPVVEYEGGHEYGPPKPIKRWRYPIKPAELREEQHFERRGDMVNWGNGDPDQVHHADMIGGIAKLVTANPATQDILIKVAKWWIKETDIDGFRLDVYKHVDSSMWDRFFPEVRAYAASLGKTNFLATGEIYDGDPKNLVPEVRPGRLDSAYNFTGYFWFSQALHGEAPTRVLETGFHALREILGDVLQYLLNFLDNHDRPRFLRPNDSINVLRVALAYLFMTEGIPYVYYGTEQAFRQIEGLEAKLEFDASRYDMFPGGKFKDPSVPDDGFNTEAPLYKLMGKLSSVRRSRAALRRGRQYVRWSDPSGPGIFAFSRIHGDEEVLVVLNTSGEPRRASMAMDAGLSPPLTELQDDMDPGYRAVTYSAESGTKVDVEVPPHGVRVLSRHAGRLAELKQAYPVLAQGKSWTRWSEPDGPGIRAFSHIRGSQEVVVVLNTSAEPRSISTWVDANLSPPQITEFQDVLDRGDNPYRVRVYRDGGGAKVAVEVPPMGMRVLVRRSEVVGAGQK